jgi:hypothetical protein
VFGQVFFLLDTLNTSDLTPFFTSLFCMTALHYSTHFLAWRIAQSFPRSVFGTASSMFTAAFLLVALHASSDSTRYSSIFVGAASGMIHAITPSIHNTSFLAVQNMFGVLAAMGAAAVHIYAAPYMSREVITYVFTATSLGTLSYIAWFLVAAPIRPAVPFEETMMITHRPRLWATIALHTFVPGLRTAMLFLLVSYFVTHTQPDLHTTTLFIASSVACGIAGNLARLALRAWTYATDTYIFTLSTLYGSIICFSLQYMDNPALIWSCAAAYGLTSAPFFSTDTECLKSTFHNRHTANIAHFIRLAWAISSITALISMEATTGYICPATCITTALTTTGAVSIACVAVSLASYMWIDQRRTYSILIRDQAAPDDSEEDDESQA